jgi:hypothetical protein
MPGPPRIGGDPQQFGRDSSLGQPEATPLDPRASRHREQAQHVEEEGALDLDRIAAAQSLIGEAGIAQPAGLNQVGFRDAKLGVGCLQPAVIEQRHLYRTVGAQGGSQQFPDGRLDLTGILVVPDPFDFLLEAALPGGGFHRAESAVRGKSRATAEEGHGHGHRPDGGQAVTSSHVGPPY